MKAHPATGEEGRATSHSSSPAHPENDVRLEEPSDAQSDVPDHLRPYVVHQDASRYTAIDQSVWRFVLRQLGARLDRTAHPSYARGLRQSGISSERIPLIADMNRCLATIGWRAVCVDGFIPPRAFQSFQSLGILPIAAEIRTPDHLPYTPAPDIIHEAAGHAPILVDETYAGYVRRIGDVATRAFSSPEDARVDAAVRTLSDLEDEPEPEPARVRAAREELAQAMADRGEPSEAARLARLFWWTVEYGLVGTPRDYRLYGAGLLSSLGESHFCHRPDVEKRILGPECTEVGYDITRPQPQLFVARDFDHLHAVLAEVERGLASSRGGDRALRAAVASRETCTAHLSSGLELVGVLERVARETAGAYLELAPGAHLTRGGGVLARWQGPAVVPLGRLADGRDPRGLERSELERACHSVRGLRFEGGLRVRGRPSRGPFRADRSLLPLEDVAISLGDRPLLTCPGPYPLAIAGEAVGARAGTTIPACWPDAGATNAPTRRVPAARSLSPERAELERAYARSLELERRNRPDDPRSTSELEALYHVALARHPHEWLLYWNLLERFGPHARHAPLARKLQSHLIRLEDHYGGRHPITMGLEYLTLRV